MEFFENHIKNFTNLKIRMSFGILVVNFIQKVWFWFHLNVKFKYNKSTIYEIEWKFKIQNVMKLEKMNVMKKIALNVIETFELKLYWKGLIKCRIC